MITRILIWIILIGFMIHLVGSFIQQSQDLAIESFETIDDVYSQQITSFMTATSEILCPTYKFIIEERAREQTGSEEEKRLSAEKGLIKQAGGALFPCPPPNDPIAVPADIADRIQRTIQYFQTEIQTLLKNVQGSLDCPTEGFQSGSSSYYEHFQDICSADQLALKKQTVEEAAAQDAAKACIAPQDLTPQRKTEILKRRADTLTRLLTQKEVATQLAKIKQGTEEVVSLKKRALAGELVPNCPV